MQKRRGRRVLAVGIVVLTSVSLFAWARHRSALLNVAQERALSAVSAVSAWASSSPLSPWSPPADADAATLASSDAGTPPPRHQTAPLSSAQLGAPLVHGSFVTACGAPESMKVIVQATVRMGRAARVKVTTLPPDAVVASCVERAARELQWDISPKTDHVTVNY